MSDKTCMTCGREPQWKDSMTGANRCRVCVATHGGGRPHVLLPRELVELDADGTVLEEDAAPAAADDQAVAGDPVAVWDDLEAQRVEFVGYFTDPMAEWADCVIDQGKTQAMEIARLRAQLAASMPLPAELLKVPQAFEGTAEPIGWVNVDERMPPDRETVLVAYFETNGGVCNYQRPIRAEWVPAKTEICDTDVWGQDGDYDEEKDEYFVPEGWYEECRFHDSSERVEGTVTHWHAIPTFPPMRIKGRMELVAGDIDESTIGRAIA